jgi:hypothetical protein
VPNLEHLDRLHLHLEDHLQQLDLVRHQRQRERDTLKDMVMPLQNVDLRGKYQVVLGSKVLLH